MIKRIISISLALLMTVLSSSSYVYESGLISTCPYSSLAKTEEKSDALAYTEEQVSTPPKLDVGNHISNGSFNMGAEGFNLSKDIPIGILTEADGNLYASATFDIIYRSFTSEKMSLEAGTPYAFSFDYFVPADNPNLFAYGLSAVAGHPNATQQIKPNGTAPYTITDRDTGTVIQSFLTNTSLVRYGSGTRTLAVDGADRTNNNETGGWRHFETSFTLSADVPSAYFYFMSYEQGKKADGTTLSFKENQKISFDNINLKGLYSASVSTSVGGKAQMEILDMAPIPGKVYEGGRVRYTAVPELSNGFVGWKDDSGTIVSTEADYIARISGGTHLTATFVALVGTSQITVMPGIGGTITSDQFDGIVPTAVSKEFINGTAITLQATAYSGKNFIAWTDENNSPISYEKNYTFYTTEPQTIKPFFDTENDVYNGDFTLGTDGWKTYGDSASNVAINVLNKSDLENEKIPLAPSGHPALKLNFKRTDGTVVKRVQAYSDHTFLTEKNTTYVVSAWVYSSNHNVRLSLFVPTTAYPYQMEATNEFTYVGSGYSVGATQLAGTYKYLLNDKIQSQNGTYSTFGNGSRSIDPEGNIDGWTKMSITFTTDDNANCVKNATVSLGIRAYSKDGIDYTSGTAYFADISVKKTANYKTLNNKMGGSVTVNDKPVFSSLDGTAQFGDLLKLNADTFDGFIFDGWFRDKETVPFTTNEDIDLFYTGSDSYEAKYSYDTGAENFMLGDFESVLDQAETAPGNDGDIDDDNTTDLKDVTLLSRYVAGWSGLSVLQDKLDMTSDGEIDLLDITYLSRLVAGWTLPRFTLDNVPEVWKLLANGSEGTEAGTPLTWGSYNVVDGTGYSVSPHGGSNMLAVNGRGNYSNRTLDVTPNTDYMLTFFWYQNAGVSNTLNSIVITEYNDAIKIGSQTEFTNPSLSAGFLAQNYTPISANGTWRKYTISFNSKNNTVLKLFIKYTADSGTTADTLFLDDFSLLPFNTETASGSASNLTISNNIAPLNTTFKGISSSVYHCYTFMDDIKGRNYTDEMAKVEMDRLRDTGTKMVRSIFKTWFAWDDTKGTWDWESQRMQDAYHWALELQKRDINIALNASWNFNYLVTGESNIPEVPYLYANGDYTLACARYGEWMKQALVAFEAHGVHNITHLIIFTEPNYPTATQPNGPYPEKWVQAAYALDTALTSAGIRNNYKLIGPSQSTSYYNGTMLDYALKNCDDVIDIYSAHIYPHSTSIFDDVFVDFANTHYSNYMNTMASNHSTKDFWADEFFAFSNDAYIGVDSAWAGTQTAASMTSAMNHGVESMISWQIFDQLWVDQTNTGGQFVDGVHVTGTTPSLLISAVPKRQYYALTLMSKYFGYQNGRAYTSTAPAGTGLYISSAKLEDGSWTVMVANVSKVDKKFTANFSTAINQTLYRHLYDPDTLKPDARAKVIEADKVYPAVGTSLVDTIPSGGMAIYTGLGS